MLYIYDYIQINSTNIILHQQGHVLKHCPSFFEYIFTIGQCQKKKILKYIQIIQLTEKNLTQQSIPTWTQYSCGILEMSTCKFFYKQPIFLYHYDHKFHKIQNHVFFSTSCQILWIHDGLKWSKIWLCNKAQNLFSLFYLSHFVSNGKTFTCHVNILPVQCHKC